MVNKKVKLVKVSEVNNKLKAIIKTFTPSKDTVIKIIAISEKGYNKLKHELYNK